MAGLSARVLSMFYAYKDSREEFMIISSGPH